MATTDVSYSPAYALDNGWREARRRLELLEEMSDPMTFRHLDSIGVGAGWRCLEVGGGAGSVTRALAQRVGSHGHVTAVDLDIRFLADIDASNVEVRRLDVVVDPLPQGDFDFVHTRAVLMHLPEREAVVRSLVRALRPGGWLLMEEADAYPALAVATGAYRRAFDVAHRPALRAGMAQEWARHLPAVACSAGLTDVCATTDVTLFPGGSTAAELLRLTWVQLLESDDFTPEERADIDGARIELIDPTRWFTGWALVAAWGRRP